jgi:primosomal protein N' (replication factor Y) (superfamily II helicase)
MNHSTDTTVPVLLPLAIPGPYTYSIGELADLASGDVVEVPLGPRQMMGVVWAAPDAGETVPAGKLRAVERRLPGKPIPLETRRFVDWVAAYTLSPPGMVLRMVLRSESALDDPKPVNGIRLSGAEPERMTPARQRVLEVFQDGLAWPKRDLIERAGVSPGVVDTLVDQGVLESVALPPPSPFAAADPDHDAPNLTEAQGAAAQTLRAAVKAKKFSVTLIDGVTGSGKTEVYFEAVAEALRQGKQSLILLPEIALTAQFLGRFEARFGVEPAQWHSQLTSSQRETAWRAVHRGEAPVVVGARSALFLPFPDLGLIVVDEEHDPAYKQEDRVTYNARDMAVVRGHLGGFAVALSTATPSIETRVNADSGRYARVVLPARYGAKAMPSIDLVDMKADPPEKGRFLSPVLVEGAEAVVAQGGQVLFFLNRRGYAPLTLCRTCGHRFMCPDCAAWLVEHRFRGRLACHHCGFTMPAPKACPNCGTADSLVACGPGVERVAEEARELFPEARLTILSSDLVAGVTEMRQRFADIAEGRYDIVVGTQLIAKGHHFPLLTLVGVVDGDLGLGQGDMRAAERIYQLLHQVVGRAGRGDQPGRGMIQTYLPEHPVMQALASGGEEAFYSAEIAARQRYSLPPFGRLAALIVSGRDRERVTAFARRLTRLAPQAVNIAVLGPAEAPLALVRGRHRWRLLVKTARNVDLQAFLRAWLSAAGEPKGGVRLSVDVDPYSFL